MRSRSICHAALALALLARSASSQQQRPQTAAVFEVAEAPISQLQDAMKAGKITSRGLVDAYLARIRAYDEGSRGLNAIITLNPNARADADALDRERAQKGPRGPLHGIPIIVKDNYNTVDMATTAGSIALAGFVPKADAFQVKKLREAGAVILGKSNMHELASGITTISSLGGQTRNPYDPRRNPGGSSGGTGAAIAASFAAVGMGSDTCGSIRIPSAHNNLVGLRPTKGLSSIGGMIPLSSTQDVGGPLARTVEDLAITLDATIGEDPEDSATKLAAGTRPLFTSMLRTDALRGTRIGILKPLFGTAPDDQEVGRIVNSAIDAMKRQGAVAVDVPMPELAELSRNTAVIDMEFREDFDQYLRKNPGAAVQSLKEILDHGLIHTAIEASMNRRFASKGRDSDEYRTAMKRRAALQESVLAIMKEQSLDAVVYPVTQRKAAIIGEPQGGTNCQLSASTGFPAISMPAGFTTDGIPVGVELLAGPLDDGKLVGFAYAFEHDGSRRRAPALTPALTSLPPDRTLAWDVVATGTTALRIPVRLSFNPSTNELSYVLAASPSNSDILFVTIHRAAPGQDGPVVQTLATRGGFRPAGSVELSSVDRKSLSDGNLYLNIGTRRFPQGEVRAQLKSPLPF